VPIPVLYDKPIQQAYVNNNLVIASSYFLKKLSKSYFSISSYTAPDTLKIYKSHETILV
jgi:hypothetical protein